MDWFEMLRTAYPKRFEKLNRAEVQKTRQIYEMVLSEYGEDVLYDAARRWLQKKGFMPDISELREECDAVVADRNEALGVGGESYKYRFDPRLRAGLIKSYGEDFLTEEMWKHLWEAMNGKDGEERSFSTGRWTNTTSDKRKPT